MRRPTIPNPRTLAGDRRRDGEALAGPVPRRLLESLASVPAPEVLARVEAAGAGCCCEACTAARRFEEARHAS